PGSDTLIASRNVVDLQKGATSSATDSISLATVPTGTYYVGMYADDLFQISEVNEGNNAKASPSAFDIGPNLKEILLSATISGGNISISDTVQNVGSAVATAPFNVSFYFSADTTFGVGDTLIGSRTVTSDLAANGTSSASTSLPIPPALAVGTYYVVSVADSGNAVTETNETDNTRATSGTYAIGPDLVVFSLVATPSGGNVSASDTERNQGNQAAGPFEVSFYLSSDNTLDGGDLLIGSRTVAAGLAVNATNSASTTLSLASASPGDYFLCALSDSGTAVPETNDTNNSKCATTVLHVGPDLKVFSLTISKSAGNVSVSDTEQNAGNQTAGAATVTFYLSLDQTLDGGDVLLGSRNFPSLAVNTTNSGTNLFTPPGGTAAGNYYVIAVTDSGNVVTENNSTGTGETNNTLVSSITVPIP
ncbi:MAG TPA: CARDB domain-containing protein, partial [Nitrospiria bacterium]|nr:CARDB domain-containing protein [Nitrospiria bacterium]